MRRVTAVLGAAMVLVASAASAQEKPNFSGTWTLDAEKTQASNPAMPGGGGGGGGGGRGGAGGGRGMGGGMGGGPLTLTVDAASLTSEREGPQGPIKVVYKLDGTAQQVPGMGGPGGQAAPATATAKWDGNTIVIETTRSFNGNSIVTKAVYKIEGEYLVIENTNQGRDGQAMTRKQYYKKS